VGAAASTRLTISAASADKLPPASEEDKMIKLTEPERTTIVSTLILAARQYEIDAEHASELALHGMAVFEPAEALAKQFQQHATDVRQLRDKITFLWEHIQL
jgi:hypothetical protein